MGKPFSINQMFKDLKKALDSFNETIKQAELNQKIADQQLIEKCKKDFPEMHLKCPVCDTDLIYDWLSQPTEKYCKTHNWADRCVEIICKCPNDKHHICKQYKLEQITNGFAEKWDEDCKRAIKDWEFMNRPEYDNKCAKCGKLYDGYENMECIEIDGKQLCPTCSEYAWVSYNKGRYVSKDYIRDERNNNSMYEGINQFYSSVNEMLKHHNCLHGMKRDDLYIVHYPSRPNVDIFGLSGDIYGEHWEFYGKSGTKWPHYHAYTFKFLPDMEGIEIRECKAKK